MNLTQAVLEGLQKSLVTKGRATRAQFWCFALIYWPVASFMLPYIIKFIRSLCPQSDSGIFIMLFGGVASIIAVYIPLLTAMIRRLHDVDKPGYLWLLLFIPIANFYLIYLLAKKGTANNRG